MVKLLARILDLLGFIKAPAIDLTEAEHRALVYQEMTALLASPDEDCMPPRRHHLTQEGDPNRHLKCQALAVEYYTYRMLVRHRAQEPL